LDFTAIDFETANGFRGSPCSVGLTRVRDGRIAEEAFWLMRPPPGHDHFDPRNVQIHGVTAGQVASAPRFADVFPLVSEFLGTDVVVAHNAAFDTGVIRSALEVSGLAGTAYSYACTVILSRRSYSLPSYSLPFVAEAAGVPLVNHHDAVEDARACAGIMVDIAGRNGAASIGELFTGLGLRLPRSEAFDPAFDGVSAATLKAQQRAVPAAGAWLGWPEEGPNPAADSSADRAHPLYGQTVVFTGNLALPRPDAKLRAAGFGAQPASGVTRATTVLVVGDGFSAADLRNGRLTSKARRVLELHARGQRIEVLSEGEFMQMVG
jgi:DNA polymerase-3 subunit epsilon